MMKSSWFGPVVRPPVLIHSEKQPAPMAGNTGVRGAGLRTGFLLAAALALALALILSGVAWAANQTAEGPDHAPHISLPENVSDAASRQASQIKQQIEERTRSLFRREPLGFDVQTAQYLYGQLLTLPARVPQLMRAVVEQGRLLGAVGSLLVLVFLIALVYSVFGQKRLMHRIERTLEPLAVRLPDNTYPHLVSVVRVVVAALFPLILLAAFSLINALIAYDAAWFQLIGRLLLLWSAGALVINLLRELLTRDIFGISAPQGKSIFRPARLITLYSIFAVGLFWAAAAFRLRQDVLAFMQFAISLSIVVILFLMLLKKKSLLSLLPDLPHPSYQKFLRFFGRIYFPLIVLSLVLALLWVLGYRTLGRVLLVKIWASVGAYLVIMLVYHFLNNALRNWYDHSDRENEAAGYVYRSFKNLLLYATIIATILVVLNLIGLLGLLQQAMSFPVFQAGGHQVTLWIILKAVLILFAFFFMSRLLQAYLDYRIYPAIGVEPGLGYAINTFLKYLMLGIGFVVALDVVGLDLRFLLVFAGAVGIGVGMGLQNMAANVISGFTLIFGGKLRKGDWIEVGNTMGMVTDIHLRATMVRTRDDIEYLIPNTEFITGVLTNYSLGSPLIRIAVPVGVSYNADPRQVEKILLDVAAREPLVSKAKQPVVRFTEFADSSINFELLIWINVRTTPRRKIRSSLYFVIFEELAKAGIEIPFPQRDIHVRSQAPHPS